MSLTLAVGPVGSGKTARASAALLEYKQARPLAPVWVLMATGQQINALRGRLITPGGVLFNVRFFNFHMLYEQLTQAAEAPARVLLSHTRAALLREVLRERWHGEGAMFRPLPGFVDVIAAHIDELKQWLITPEQFAAAAGDHPRLRELAAIYALYEERLAGAALVDRQGLGLRALELARARPALAAEAGLLLVDGFDQLNPLHAALIAALARRIDTRVSLTIPDGPGALSEQSRFTLARDRLLAAYRAELELPPEGPDNGDLRFEEFAAAEPRTEGSRALRHLTRQVWSPAPQRLPCPAKPDDALLVAGLNLLEAPDPAAETAAMLRRVKALLLGKAGLPPCRPDDILIAARDWPRYGPHLRTQAHRYGVPLALFQGAALAENPAVAALMRALTVPESGHRRQDVLDALATPYLRLPGMPEHGLKVLQSAARAAFVVGGRDEWHDALGLLALGFTGAADEDSDDEAPAADPALAGDAAQVQFALNEFFNAVELPPIATVEEYVEAIDGLIGADLAEVPPGEAANTAPEAGYTLDVAAAVRADPDVPRMNRDLAALNEFRKVLRGLRSSAALLGNLHLLPSDQVLRAEFMASLRLALGQVTQDDAHGRDGRVLATTVNEARGLPHKHVFLLGLSEGIFPAPAAEDPLLLDSERVALAEAGVRLPLRAERSDETGLFYEVAGLAGETLTLSRPALRDGSEWIESALWRAAEAAFDGLVPVRLRVGAVTPAYEAACADEAALAAACATGDLPPVESALAGWLAMTDGAGWARLQAAHALESSRLDRSKPYSGWSGRLADEAQIAALAARFGPDYPWSASQLNTLGECGFRFFSQRLLGLEESEPAAGGMDVMQRGTLLHHILERAYSRIRDEGLALAPGHLERALDLLREEAGRAFREAPAALGFRPQPGWAQEQARMKQQLAALIAGDFNGMAPGKAQEKAPGDGDGPRTIEWLEGGYDVPGLLTMPDGTPVRVRGRFDRIDRQGGRWLVVDYKSGSTAIAVKETAQGRNFQMMLYLLALRRSLPEGEIGGFFWHIANQQASGALWLNTEEGEAVIEQGRAHIARGIEAARRGDFAVAPNGVELTRCIDKCEYRQLCRLAVTPRRAFRPEDGS